MEDFDEDSEDDLVALVPIEAEIYCSGIDGALHVTGCMPMNCASLTNAVETIGVGHVGEHILAGFDEIVDDELDMTTNPRLIFINPVTGTVARIRKSDIIAYTLYQPSAEAISSALDEAISAHE